MANVLGSESFLDTPDVNGVLVLLQGDAVSSVTGTANQISVAGSTLPVVAIASNPVIPGTASLTLPAGTTAQRPVSPAAGMIRYNTTLGYNEKYTGVYWSPFGLLLQYVSGTIPTSTGSTQLPWDNTTPLITEGHQIWTTSFTPISATSRIVVEYTISVATSNANRVATTDIFYGSANIGATGTQLATANVPYSHAIKVVYSPGSTATVTLQGRCGLNGSGTISINAANGNNLNGTAATEYSITEIE